MKERIVIEGIKKMCDDCQCCDRPISGQIECYLEEDRQCYETVQVPETWEELKELCKDIKNISIYDNRIEIKINNNDYLYLHKNGHIYCMNEDSNISIGYDRTPQQMWNIIKSLIGEE